VVVYIWYHMRQMYFVVEMLGVYSGISTLVKNQYLPHCELPFSLHAVGMLNDKFVLQVPILIT
jgi:hypothetical protein